MITYSYYVYMTEYIEYIQCFDVECGIHSASEKAVSNFHGCKTRMKRPCLKYDLVIYN